MQEIIKRLQEINIPKRISEIKDSLKEEKNPRVIDTLVKEYKILDNLEKEGLTPEEAFTRKQVPIIPAMYRAPVELRNGIIKLPDTNILLRDIAFINDTLIKAKKEKLPKEEIKNIENLLYKSVEQLSGFDAPTMSRNVSHNAFTTLAGDASPKYGFVQRNIIRKRQNLTGRAVLTPDPSLNIDEATVPYDIGFKMYEPFIKKEFYSRGFKKDITEKHLNQQTDMAKKILRDIGKERPVIFNRAPSIRQTSVNTLWPVFTEGKEIGVPNLLAGLNPSCDFDGDSAALHVPITRKGIEDSLKMLPSRNLRWEPTGQLLTGPEHAAATGIYMLSKSKDGREKINKILSDEYNIEGKIDKTKLFSILTEVDKSKHNAGRIMNELRKLGDNYAYEKGHTIGIEDIEPFKKLRNDILMKLKIDIGKIPKDKRTQEKLQTIYTDYIKGATRDIEKQYQDKENPIGTMLLAKARGSPSQFRDIVLTPIATMGGDLIDTPIEHSYAEGLLPWEYWNTSAGARKGIIGRAQQTAMPGALAGELLATSNQLVVGNIKHKYMKSINLPIDNPQDLLDRYIGKNIKTRDGDIIIQKDTLITPKVIQRAKKFNVKILPVYSTLGSSAPDGSLASMSYGVNKDGEKPEVGTNLGVTSSHAIVDPLFTGAMTAFHTGASMEDIEAGYPRIKQILELQKELPQEAVLSSVDGEINRITKDKLGGYFVYVNGKEHYVKPSNNVVVKAGDKITKGDPISDGPIQPGELARLKSLEYAQNYMVEELRKDIPRAQRRALETIVEGITRHAKIIDPGDTDYLPGDIDILSSIDEKNEEIANKAKYEYLFKGVNLLPQLTQGWASQLNFRHLKKQLRRNIAEGAEEEKHTYSPNLSIMRGEEFGKGEKGKY